MKRGQPTHKAKQPFKKPRTVTTVVAKPPNQLFAASKKQGPERKNIDITFPLAPTIASATFTAIQPLNVVGQGNSAETRIGRKIVNTSLELRWWWGLTATSTGGSPLRILVVYDKQANAALPAITDIVTPNAFTGMMNLANSERFVILASEITEPISVQNNYSVAGTIYKKMRLETVFNDTNAGTIGDIQTGSILLMVAQDSNIAVSAGAFIFNSRIRFEDA